MAHTTAETMTPLIGTDAVAAALGVHPQTVRRLVSQGVIPFTRVSGRLHRFDLASVRAALDRAAAGVDGAGDATSGTMPRARRSTRETT